MVPETDLDRLAQLGDSTADQLHACLDQLKTLHERMLLHFEALGGDREHNWDLQGDLARAAAAVHVASTKARTVARHARDGARNSS
ncbi:MAG: hypothetical protein O3B27_02975 [Actinomycetota bacterium]|nr:hypothetical protein [Actinomycetota bacterium]MDA2950963.1 hypothetical protein [Actinomycetota bacterium]MDA2990512.1 hypothetical protein [Actinomycetota bacterium]